MNRRDKIKLLKDLSIGKQDITILQDKELVITIGAPDHGTSYHLNGRSITEADCKEAQNQIIKQAHAKGQPLKIQVNIIN